MSFEFSIIIPVYNDGPFIEGCIKAILNQTYKNYEIIVIDGGSTDGTVDVLRRYGKYFSYWHSKKDSGQTNAINKGLSLAKGDIYSWINADERYEYNTLERVVKYIKQENELVFGFTKMISLDGPYSFIRKTASLNPRLQTLLIGEPLQTDAMFWSKELSNRIGTLDEKNYPCLSMDLDWTLRLAYSSRKWKCLKEQLSERIERKGAITNSAPYYKIKRNRINIISTFLKKKYCVPFVLTKLFYPFISKIIRVNNKQWKINQNNFKIMSSQ